MTMIEMTTSSSMMVNARRIVYVLSRIFFVIPTEVEESLTISEIFRDVSISLDMTEVNRLFVESRLSLLLQALNDADERQEERDHDLADDERKKYNHDRLECRSHGRDRVVHFVVVNVCDFQKHLGQLTGFFADIDHADDHGWKCSAGFKRLNDRLAFLDALVHLANRARDHHVPGGFPGNVKGLQDWNAAADERSQSSRKP